MKALRLALAFSLIAGCATAHDMWLQPRVFWAPPNALIPVAAFVGHGKARDRWTVDDSRLLVLRSVGPRAAVDQRATLRPGALSGDLPIRLVGDGTHVLFMESGHAVSDLPALRFNDYAKEEGLTPARRQRELARKTGEPGREIYSRRAKTLIQVGRLAGPQPQVTRPVGQTLEIVPERSPYELRPGQALPLKVLYHGRPLTGATVKLTNLDADDKPVATRLTDHAGRVAFPVPRQGRWQLNVIWTRPITGDPRGDFDTTFASLSFGFPSARPGD